MSLETLGLSALEDEFYKTYPLEDNGMVMFLRDLFYCNVDTHN